MKRSKWTEAENELLKKLFPVTPTVELLPLFPSHPLRSINSQANDLGLRKTDEYRKHYLAVNRQQAIKALQGGTPWNKQEHPQLACAICGKTFDVKKYRGETARFCSKACTNAWKKTVRGTDHPLYTLVDRTCQWCGEPFKAKPAEVRYGYALFCSRNCLGSFTCSLQQGRRSSIELAIEEVLIALNQPFEGQKQVRPSLVYYHLPSSNLAIYCNPT